MPMVGYWVRADKRLGTAEAATAPVTVNVHAHSRRISAENPSTETCSLPRPLGPFAAGSDKMPALSRSEWRRTLRLL